jgi:hypothetical protein
MGFDARVHPRLTGAARHHRARDLPHRNCSSRLRIWRLSTADLSK